MMKTNLTQINLCEVCGNTNLKPVLNLGRHPLCDDLVPVGGSRSSNEYPIEILFCTNCLTAHQKYQVPKDILFPDSYHYRSKNTIDVLNGMKELVDSCDNLLDGLKGKKVLDIGCNDGSLLKIFKEKGALTYGIEPTGAYIDALDNGSEIVNGYFNNEIAEKFFKLHGKPDLITFTNVFAHIENLPELISSLKILLHSKTCIMIENHYLGAILKSNQFDTFYHEHPRTYSCKSFFFIAEKLKLFLNSIEFPSRYGGNIRVLMQPKSNNISSSNYAKNILERESEFTFLFDKLNSSIDSWRKDKFNEIKNAVNSHGPLVAKAFPGRAAIPIKILGLNQNMISAVYEKPNSQKIGHYVPGTIIPIVSDAKLMGDIQSGAPILNLAWHIKDEIEIYMRQLGFKGNIINII